MGNTCRKDAASKNKASKNKKKPVESEDKNIHLKERACYDILMRTNKDKPRAPRDPNLPYDSVKSNEVLIRNFKIYANSDSSNISVLEEEHRVRRQSKDIWANRVKQHIETTEAMKDKLDYDSDRIRNSYQFMMTPPFNRKQKKDGQKTKKLETVAEYTIEEKKSDYEYKEYKDSKDYKEYL